MVSPINRILVTGGSGYVGRHLIRELTARYPEAHVVSLSRSEASIAELIPFCPDGSLRIAMGDVRDAEALKYHTRDADVIFHLAAMKRIELGEANSREAVSVNITGTINTLDAFKGHTFVFMSTDKAVEPVSCYGATKLVAEKLVLEQAAKAGGSTRFMVVRSSNIYGSTGSVLEIWKRQIAYHNEITLTDPDMHRHFTSINDVVRLLVAVMEKGENNKIYLVPHGERVSLRELAEQVIRQYGNGSTRIRVTGKRPGERLDEEVRLPDGANIVTGFERTVELLTPVGKDAVLGSPMLEL